jgi:uncharacterized repeat protein (TIGR01451 family)
VYNVDYTICTLPATTPTPTCDTARVVITVTSVIAPNPENNTVPAGVAAPTALVNIRSNDFVNGIGATPSNSDVTIISGLGVGMALDSATGAISTSASTPPGVYSILYRLCDKATPTPNCATVTDTITVTAVITPITESATVPSGIAAPTALANIRSNDTVNGAPATTANSDISIVSGLGTGMALDAATGAISTSVVTPPGIYTILYRLCDKSAPTPNCANQTDIITVVASPILTVTKTVSQTPLAVGKLGQFYTITIAIANGPTTAPMTISDVMPAGIELNSVPTAPSGVLTNCPLTGSSLLGCMVATNVNGAVVITVPVKVTGAATGTTAVNSATVTGGGDPTCPAAAHCTGTVTTPVASPDMQVTPSTSLPPAVKDIPYPPNQTVACTNVSAIDAANAFCIVTDLPPGLISTCSPVSPVALLPAGEKIVCTISGTPTVTVAIKAKVVTGADGDSVSTNNDGVLLSTVASLSVAKTVSANPLIIGAANQYYSISIAVTNGPTIEPITLNDNFSTGITTSGPVSISGGTFKAGTCAAANSAGATSLSGCQIEPGVASTVYINVPILVDDSAEGPNGGNNTVTASGGGDPTCPVSANCVGSTGSVAVIYGDLGALFIRKVADKSTAEIGDVITYKVTVRSTKIKGKATVEDHLPIGFRLIGNTTRVSKNGVLVAAADPAGAPGPNLTFTVQIPAIDQDVEIEYKVRVGLGADRGDGINSAQASMVNGRLRSLIAKAKVKISGGVFTREACIVGKVYADCNGNAVQDKGELGVPGVKLYLEDGTSMTADENGLYSICGVRAITHVLKVDGKTLPKGSKLGITSSRNAGDPNSLFVDVLAGQLHNTEFRIDSCSPGLQQTIDSRQTGVSGSNGSRSVVLPTGGVQFDSAQPKISGSGLPQPATKAGEAGSKQ